MKTYLLSLFIITLSLNCMEDPKSGSKKPESQLQGHDQPSCSYSQEASTSENTLEPSSVTVTMGTYHRTISLTQARSITCIAGPLYFERGSKTVSLNDDKSTMIISNHLFLDKLLTFDLDYSLELANEEIVPLFEIADYLGFKPETLRQLTLRAQKQLPPNQQSPNIKEGLYLNSINSLINNRTLNYANGWKLTEVVDIKPISEDDNHFYALKLSHLELDNLDGFERLLTFITVPIHKLILDNNSIKLLNVEWLLKCCPTLHSISAQHNDIDELLCPKQLPDQFNLILKNNTIKESTPFKMGERSYLDVEGCELSPEAEHNFQQAISSTFFERHRHRLRAWHDSLDLVILNGTVGFLTFYISNVALSLLYKQFKAHLFIAKLATLERLISKCTTIKDKELLQTQYYFLSKAAIELLPSSNSIKKTLFSSLYVGLGGAVSYVAFFAIRNYYTFDYANNLIHQYVPGTLTGTNKQNNWFKLRFLKRCKQTLNRYL